MEKPLSKNIQNIVDNALCSACGGCAGICPVGAISMKENAAGFINAKVDEKKCLYCQMCFSICPSNGNRERPDLIGKTVSGYVGYSTDSKLRAKGQSGGVVTTLLKWLFECKQIDGAVVTRFNCEKKRAESFLAVSAEDVFCAQGSHYTQTSPVEIILKNQDKRLAAVLLGCQTACLNQISLKFPKVNLPVLTIGLICGGNLSGYVAEDLLNQGRVKSKEKLCSFRFRDKEEGGWPGNIIIHTQSGSVQIPKEKRMELKPYYQNYRCMLCAEKMNQCCDIAVGDPWGITFPDEALGYSAVITRTEYGDRILKDAAEKGVIFLRKEDLNSIAAGQKINTDLKERLLRTDEVLEKHAWKAPYALDEQRIGRQYPDDLDLTLSYLRNLQFAQKKEEALQMINRRKKESVHPVKEFLYRVKKRVFG